MSSPALKTKGGFTYGDYVRWPQDERWEIIDGEAFDMSPAPGMRHQSEVGELHRQLANHLLGQPCKVFVAPFDVRLPVGDEPDEHVPTVVQPDVIVVCDSKKLDEKGCRGAPDLVIEVLSPRTTFKDTNRKFRLYERNGVKEYWIVYPEERTLSVYHLNDEKRYGPPDLFSTDDRVTPGVLPGLSIEMSLVFAE